MKSILSMLMLCFILVHTASAALVYDPVTNTYVSTTPSVTIPSGNSWTGTINTGDVATGSTTTGTITTPPIAAVSSTIDTGVANYKLPDPSLYKGSLSAMHIQLDNSIATVMNRLNSHITKLNDTNSDNLKQAADRLRTLTCLGIITPTDNIYDALRTSADNLRRSIEIVSSDLHGDIGALEEKISKKVLDQLIQQLEISSMQNKIDAFLSEYLNVVDLFFEVSIGEVDQLEKLFSSLSADAKKNLDTYNETSEAYNTLMQAYDAFLSKSSFAGVVAGPHLQELVDLTEGLKTYRRSVLLSKRQAEIVWYVPTAGRTSLNEQKKQLLQSFSLLFNEEAQGILGDLYPIDELLLLNRQIIGIRSAYTDEKTWFADCQAFVSNPTVKITGPELQTYMNTLLEKLNSAANKVAKNETLPTNKTELLQGLKKGIDTAVEPMVKELISSNKAELKNALQTKGITRLWFNNLSKTQQLEAAVRTYLQKKYASALSDGTIATFQDKLWTISQKIEDKIATGQLSTNQTKLLATIQTIVMEFLE